MKTQDKEMQSETSDDKEKDCVFTFCILFVLKNRKRELIFPRINDFLYARQKNRVFPEGKRVNPINNL